MFQRQTQIQEWREEREIVIACLYSLADQLDKAHENANKAGIVGSSLGIGGTAIGLTCAAVSPFCAGVSLIPGAIIAGGSGIIGSASSVVNNLVEGSKKKKVFKDVESLLEDDKRCTDEVRKIAQNLDDAEDRIQRYLAYLVGSAVDDDQQEAADGQMVPVPSSSDPGFARAPLPARYAPPPHSKSAHMKDLVHRGLRRIRMSDLKFLQRQAFQVGKTFVKDGATAGKQAMKAVRIGKVVQVSGIVISVIALPFEVHELITRVKDLKDGKGHPSTAEIRDHAEKLKDGISLVQKELYGKLTTVNNLVLLIQNIKKHGCDERLNSILNQILKELLPVKDLIKAFDKLDPIGGNKPTFSLDEEELSGMVINYRDVGSGMFRELAVVLWAAWQMGSKSCIFLQNTGFSTPSPLWTLFGVTLNSFGVDSELGVSIVLPLDFQGDVVTHHEFPDPSKPQSDSWRGRCVLANVNIGDTYYTLVNLLAPEKSIDRALFMQEAATFIRDNTYEKLIIGANFQPELQTMKVEVKKKKVCPNTPWSVMEKFLPYREVAEYLVNVLPFSSGREAEGPAVKVYEVCTDFSVEDAQLVFIDWKHCKRPIIWETDCSAQIEPVMRFDLVGLWKTKNPGAMEFSTEKRVGREAACCSRSLELLVNRELAEEVRSCSWDHDLRFLGFLKESVLKF